MIGIIRYITSHAFLRNISSRLQSYIVNQYKWSQAIIRTLCEWLFDKKGKDRTRFFMGGNVEFYHSNNDVNSY